MSAAVKKEITRRISLDADCFNYNIDFVFFGFLLSVATARPKNNDNKQWELYLSENKYVKCRPLLRKWLGGVSAQTIRNKLKKFIEMGMIKYDSQEKVYTFPYDYNGKYYIISRDIIFYLCATATSLVIQTYIYLASRFSWKKDYEFTVTEIKNILGYSANSQNSSVEQAIAAAIVSLQQQGLISYEVRQLIKETEVGQKYGVKKYVLTNVKTSIMPEQLTIELKKVLPGIKPRLTMTDIFKVE